MRRARNLFWLVLVTVPAWAAPNPDPINSALDLLATGRTQEAGRALDDLRADGAESSRLRLLAGLVARERGDLAGAVASFRQGLNLSVAEQSDDLSLRLELAVTLSWDQQLAAALAEYRTVLTARPGNLPARLGEARVLGWLGKHRAARTLYRRILEEHSDERAALLGLAAVERADLAAREAERLYRRVLERWPDDAEAQQGLEAVEEIRRFRLSWSTESQQVGGRATEVAQAVSLAADLDGAWSLRAALRRQGFAALPDAILLGAGDGGLVGEEQTLATVWRPAVGRTLGATYQRSSFGGARNESLLIEVSQRLAPRLAPRLTLVAGLRPSRSSSGEQARLAFVGASFSGERLGELLVQAFAGEGSAGLSSRAVAVSWNRSVSERLAGRLAVSLGEETAGSFSSLAANLRLGLARGFEVSLGAERFDGAFRRETLSLAVARRF